MKKLELRMKLVTQIYNLISSTCSQRINNDARALHIAIIKKHYNAIDVTIDYYRKRIVMDIVMDDIDYSPDTINTHIPTFKANFYYLDLQNFLKSCIAKDDKSIAFYACLLQEAKQKTKNMHKLLSIEEYHI